MIRKPLSFEIENMTQREDEGGGADTMWFSSWGFALLTPLFARASRVLLPPLVLAPIWSLPVCSDDGSSFPHSDKFW
jgi:hypothetical protein